MDIEVAIQILPVRIINFFVFIPDTEVQQDQITHILEKEPVILR